MGPFSATGYRSEATSSTSTPYIDGLNTGELIGILCAIHIINEVILLHWRAFHTLVRRATILSDTMSALQAIQPPGNRSGQQVIHVILQASRNTKTPRHIDLTTVNTQAQLNALSGNNTADPLAKEAAIPEKAHPLLFAITGEGTHQPRNPGSITNIR
ncbi:hypothetical protein N7453_000472 [Penicillium expansum]|nr:hypothetical protein N7453_000472 [Penicillium expansum]